MSIINKIAQSINMLFKSNKEIVKKYQGKINSAKCADLTFNGYNVSADKFAARIDSWLSLHLPMLSIFLLTR